MINQSKKSYSYCPFCSKPLSFNLDDTSNIHTCPVCNSPIKVNFSQDKSEARIVNNIIGFSFEKNGFFVENGVLIKYDGKQTDITIPQDVVSIGKNVFKNNTNIKSVTFSSQVKHIQESAFENCNFLRKIMLSKSIKTIANCAFKDCRRIETVSIPNSLIAAGYMIFNGCDNITECILPMDMKFLGGSPTTFCNKLRKTNIPNCVSDTSHWICENPNLEEIIIGKNARRFPPFNTPKLSLAHFTNPNGWKVIRNLIDKEVLIPVDLLSSPKKAALTIKKLAKEGKTLINETNDYTFDYYLEI